MIGGCTTQGLDKTATTSIAPVTADISAGDLAAGKAQFREANYGLAEKHFRKAVELRADNSEAWMGLAASYDQLGRFDFADRAYDQLLKVAGRRPEIVNNMGYSQLLRGNRKKAQRVAERSQERHGRPGGGRRQSGAAARGVERGLLRRARHIRLSGGQEQTRLRSPATLSMRETGGQYFAAFASPAG